MTRTRIGPPAPVLALVVVVVAACGGPAAPPAATAAPASGSAGQGVSASISCGLLAPSDFAAAGIDGAGPPTDNPDSAGGHSCAYTARSGAMGGIELDVFPNESEAVAKQTYETVVGEGPSGRPLSGGAFSQASFAVDGGVAYLSVRQGTLVLGLTVPNDMNAEAGLVALARLVVERAAAR